MSFVGPRPALYNQYDLIALRTQKGVDVTTWHYGLGTSEWTR